MIGLPLALLISLAGGAGDEDLHVAERAFASFDYARALVQLEIVLGEPELPPATRVRALVLAGIVRFTAGDRERAELAFCQALSIDVTATLPAGHAPKIQVLFERLRDSELDRRLVAPPPAIAPSAGPAADPSRSTPWLPITLAGGSAVAAGSGGLLLYLAHLDSERADRRRWANEAVALHDRAVVEQYVGIGLWVVAGAALAGAGLVYFLSDEPAPTGVAVSLAPPSLLIRF